MPLSKKGSKIKAAMAKTYGPEKGEQVFYASVNKGTIKGAKKPGYNPGERHARMKKMHKKMMGGRRPMSAMMHKKMMKEY
jgi:hypothetical protein